jgi:hypothetical protein
LGFLEGGALFGLISGGLVNVGIGISEIAAGIEGTPIDAEAMETGLTIAKSPLNVGLVAAGTAAGLSAKQAASAEEMFETGMCVKEISEGSEELEKLLSVVSFFGNKLFGTGEVEGGNEGNENADDTDSDEEGDGSGDASDDGGSGEDRNQDGKPRDE